MFVYVLGICTNNNNNCAVKCEVSKVRSLKCSGEGFVGKCAYTHCNAFDAHLNEQVTKGRVPTTGTFVKLWSLVAACHIVGMVHIVQIIIATSLLLSDCGYVWNKSKEPPVIIYLQCRDLFHLHDSVVLHEQKGLICG